MAVRRLRTGDAQGNQARLSERDDAAPLLACPLLLGHQVAVTLKASAANTPVPHGLGRPYVGWFVVRNADPAVSPGEVPGKDASKVLRLSNPSASDVALELWIY